MYSQLLSYLAALLIFTLQQPGPKATFGPAATLALWASLLLAYGLIAFLTHRRLGQAAADGMPLSAVTRRYHRLQMQLSLLALGILGIDVFVLNIKFYLSAIPGFEKSLTLPGATGLLLYVLHQIICWYWGHPLYRVIHQSGMSRSAFIRGHLSFNGAFLIPWLLISLISDLIDQLDHIAFLKTVLGQYLSFALSLALFILLAPWIMVHLWRCESLPPGGIRAELERFCGEQRFSLGDIKIWPLFGGETLTAGIVGVVPPLRYILITRGLLALLNGDELKAVMAHEMGHARRLHLPFFLLFFLGYAALTFAYGDLLLAFLLNQEFFLRWSFAGDSSRLSLFSLAYSLPVLLVFLLYFRFVFGFFLRNSERQADLYALKLIGHPFTLISSLEKIAVMSGQTHDLPNWHHFSIRERVTFLLQCHERPLLARRHNQKLYGAATVVACCLAILVWGGSHLKRSDMVQAWYKQIDIKRAEILMQFSPDDPHLETALGGALLELGRHRDAEHWLVKALEALPDDPVILNNLAWFYATAPPPYFMPEAALKLAKEAAEKAPEPYILDTLAEAYHVNGRHEEALRTIELALEKNPEKREYFLGQKAKMEEALKKMR
ncbi:MAG: M48 family metalloprotease [Syntrophobacteraceae bacterium]